jgi:hypothetical protein
VTKWEFSYRNFLKKSLLGQTPPESFCPLKHFCLSENPQKGLQEEGEIKTKLIVENWEKDLGSKTFMSHFVDQKTF